MPISANDLGGASTHDLFLFLYPLLFWCLTVVTTAVALSHLLLMLSALSWALFLSTPHSLTHSSGWFCCCRWVVMMTSILPNLLVQNGDDPAQLITCCNFFYIHIFHKQIYFHLFLQLLAKSLRYLSSWIVNFNTN